MRILILLVFLFPLQSMAETSLWTISKGDSKLFIGGTVHVLGKDDYPLPKEFDQAYQQAQLLVFETDMLALAKPEMQMQLLQRLQYKKGRSLKDDLSKKTYKFLSDYLVSKNLSIEQFNSLKPSMVMVTLLMIELQHLGMASVGVDSYYNKKAQQDGKALGELETIQEHISILENMGKGREDDMILNTINEMKTLSSLMDGMKKAWRKGDTKALSELGVLPMKADFPELYKLLLVDRNNSWIPKIKKLMTTPEIELVLVGALHVVGSEGLISQLKGLGYKVELF